QRPEAALAAVEQAERARAHRDESLLFLRGDLLCDLGRLDEAEALLAGFEEASFRELLRGRIALARGDARGALEAFDAGLRRWPDNAGARYLAGLAARELGDEARAIAELRGSVRADAGATAAALALAALESARGAHREALEAARLFLERRSRARPEAHRIAIEAQSALGLHDAARRSVAALREAGFPLEAALAAAAVEAAAARAAAGASAATAGAAEDAGVAPAEGVTAEPAKKAGVAPAEGVTAEPAKKAGVAPAEGATAEPAKRADVAVGAAAAAALRASGLDPALPAHEPLLRALVEALLAAGRDEEALAAVDGALARDPERASLAALRG